MYNTYFLRKDDEHSYSSTRERRYDEYKCTDLAKRKVVIPNVPKREKVRNELLKELDKDEHMFGPIREFKIIIRRTNCIAFIIYENRTIHKDVIDYYNRIKPLFHGVILFFEASFDYINPTELTYLDSNDYERRDVIISNVPIEHDNIDRRLYQLLQKNENMFGPIESLTLKRAQDSTEIAYVRYANINMHKEVIRYYNHVKVDFYGHRLFFEPAYNIRLKIMKHFDDKDIGGKYADTDSGLRCNNNLILLYLK